MNEAINEEYGDFWHGPIDLELLYRPDGDDDDEEEFGFGNLRPGQKVPNNTRYGQPKRKRNEEAEDLAEAGSSGWGRGYEPGPSNRQDRHDDNSDAESEFGLARFFKKPKKN